MKFPLFLQTPTSVCRSSSVLVPSGDWIVETDKTDSVLNLTVGDTTYPNIANGHAITLQSKTPAWAEISEKGTEKSISFYLKAQ